MNFEPKSTVALEKLLRLKRAEHPGPEFWTEFEQELRAKQLAAIMEKRRWWDYFAAIFAGAVRRPGPLGAAAALAVTLFGLQAFHSAGSKRPASPLVSSVSSPALATLSQSDDPTSRELRDLETSVAPRVERAAISLPNRPTPNADAPGVTRMIASRITSRAAAPAPVEIASSPFAHSIVVNMTVAQTDEPETTRAFLGIVPAFSTGNHLQITRPPAVDPLTQMTSPSSERRSRILAEVLPASGYREIDPPSSDRLVTRISDERLYESISRYGAGGDHFSVKF